MSEKVVQLKPKAFDGLYRLPGKSEIVLRSINDYGVMVRSQQVVAMLAEEKLARAYFEVAENANHLLRRWFRSPKSYNLDNIVLKRDLTQEYNFSFFLSGTGGTENVPIITFHVSTYFTPSEELIKASELVFQETFPVAVSVQKAKEHLAKHDEHTKICSVEQLNLLITELDEVASEFDHKRFGFVSQVGDENGSRTLVLGYRYFDRFVENVAGSQIVGFEVDGSRKTSMVEVRLEINLDYVDVEFAETRQ